MWLFPLKHPEYRKCRWFRYVTFARGRSFLGLENKTRIYQASTSELYGKVQEVPQSETTHFTHVLLMQ
jgi:hypothetical protein